MLVQPLLVNLLCALHFVLAISVAEPVNATEEQLEQSDQSDLNTTILSDSVYTRGAAQFTQTFKPELGVFQGIPFFRTSINTLYEIAIGDFKGFEETKVFKFAPYSRFAEIFVEGTWGRKPGVPKKWRREYVLEAILELVRQSTLAKKLEGFVSDVSVLPAGKREATITFRNPTPPQNTTGTQLQAGVANDLDFVNVTYSVGHARVQLTPLKESEIEDYRTWDRINVPEVDLNGTLSSLGAQPEFHVKFAGAIIPPSDFMIAIAEGMRMYAEGPGKTKAIEVDKDIDSFSTHLEVSQYYKQKPRPDRIMNRRDALLALVLLPPYALQNRVFQECTMVMEQRLKEPIGIIRITRKAEPGQDSLVPSREPASVETY